MQTKTIIKTVMTAVVVAAFYIAAAACDTQSNVPSIPDYPSKDAGMTEPGGNTDMAMTDVTATDNAIN